MIWEYVGDCGRNDPKRKWQELRLGIAYLEGLFGEVDGCTLEITMNPHELGDYPSIGVWGDTTPSELANYAVRLQNALMVFNQSVQWNEITPEAIAEQFDYNLDSDGYVEKCRSEDNDDVG